MIDFGAAEFQSLAVATDVQMADLEHYRVLLADWNARMNLVGPSALEAFWPRHAWDSAQLLPLAPGVKVWADIGAGAGFPGLVLAILLKTTPGVQIHLVESMAKRCRFLSEVVARLALPAVVHNARAEDIRLEGVDIVTARACAPMVRLLGYAEPLLRQGVVGLFLKGKDVGAEIVEARTAWRFKADLLPSRSNSEGHIVRVEAVSRG
jgi:16S rRNA (guanine527-N7)-methyltransferase